MYLLGTFLLNAVLAARKGRKDRPRVEAGFLTMRPDGASFFTTDSHGTQAYIFLRHMRRDFSSLSELWGVEGHPVDECWIRKHGSRWREVVIGINHD